jgi:dephospho-CoA kinase
MPSHGQAHLVFADIKANAKKLKELAFSQPKIRYAHINFIHLQKSPSQNEQGKNGKFRQLH